MTSIRFRNLSGEGPKYLTVPGDMSRIYNTTALETGSRSICVCEGEIDTIIASQCGLPTVGIPGADTFQKVWARLLSQYEAVYVLSDDDPAGKQVSVKLSKSLSNVRDVVMTGGDVNDFVLAHGPEALRKKVGAREA